ncbi:zinc ribbon domain-containing protein [Streptomyces chrestomyceticus]|uniref:zinc ribbon domain-containing protein n=1 Tax=Streptomyces chrestomyceticus TaxID=68185 RepID=UPI0033F7C286
MARLSGYVRPGELHQQEAQGLREGASRLLLDEPVGTVVRQLTDKGYTNARGNPWASEAFVRAILNPLMAGLDKNGEPIEDFGETVLTPDEHRRLNALFAKRRGEQAPPREPFDYLLTGGLSECGRCTFPMQGARVNGDAEPGYRCPPAKEGRPSCGGVRMNANRLEDAVAEQVLADVLRPGTHERLLQVQEDVRAEVRRLREHVSGAEERFRELGGLYGRGLLVRSAFLAAQKATKEDLRQARARLRFLEQIADVPISGVTDFVAWWKTAPRASQRALIALEVSKVRVMPSGGGRHTDPHERIIIDWRTPAN